MDNAFVSLQDAINKKISEIPKPRFKCERAALFNELYGYYERSWKKNCWSDYINWLKSNRLKHSKEKLINFKGSPSFHKKITVASFCSFWFGFIKTNDIYYLNSICKDKENRKENVNKWLFWAIKPEVK